MGVATFPFPVTKHLTRSYLTEEDKRREGEKRENVREKDGGGREAQRREREGTRGKE